MNILIFLLLIYISQCGYTQIIKPYTVGIVGENWFKILGNRLMERKDHNRAILKLLVINNSVPFLEDMESSIEQLKKQEINIIVGSSSLAFAQTAAHLKIPYLAADPYICPSNTPEYSNMPHFYSLPVPEKLYALAVLDLLNAFNIKKVSVIIDSSVDYDGFVRPLFDQKSISVQMWTLENDVIDDIGKLPLAIDKILEESRLIGVWNFVVKTRISIVKTIIWRAKHYGMLVEPNKWYLPSFVCFDINIAAIRQIYSNITLINEECSESILRQKNNYTEVAMINKAIQIFRKVNWELTSEKLYKILKSDGFKSFDDYGGQIRTKFSMHTINRNEKELENLRYVGAWIQVNNKTNLNYFYQKQIIKDLESFNSRHIRVSAIEEHPHLIVLNNGSFVGFGVDLLKELSQLMNFTFSITLTTSVGSKEHSNWTGIVGEILYGRADISLGPMVQTREIEEVLDFSTSFKQREISLVMRKSSPSTTLFQFFSPFETNVWLCCIGMLIIITMAMWMVEHCHDKYFTNDEPFPLDLKESSWIAIACLLKQQMDIFPKSIPGRILHWLLIFFSLIIITSYTANLAAYLTIKVYPSSIQSIEDLANLPKNSKIIFGTVKESPIYEFFEQSEMELFQKIYRLMKKNPTWLVNDTRTGYKRALDGYILLIGSCNNIPIESYVFIWDDSVNQYEIFREPEYECNLISVGRPFGKRSFAIGIKNGSTLLDEINLNLLEIIELGQRENLDQKWWKSKSICTASETPVDEAKPLSVDEVAGTFLIVVCGTIASFGWLAVQIIIFKYKTGKMRKIQKDYLTHEPGQSDPSRIPLKNFHKHGNS